MGGQAILSEKEISKLKINVFNQCDDETIRLVAEMLKYEDQLESDKQKLAEEKTSEEEIETCKQEAKKHIEFMETERDNAGWARGLLWYIDKIESREQKLIEKLEEDKKIFSNYEERKQMRKEQLFENDGKCFYAKEILNIVKGEKNE